MSDAVRPRIQTAPSHVDVAVIGAGISGISAAYHLQTMCPDRTFTIVEARDDIGGTWDLFRYPGVRSDSDMHTLGFSFKPWRAEKSIADAESIMAYLRETVAEHDIERHIRFGHRMRAATWDSHTARWTLTLDTPDGESTLSANFVFMCAGYYSYRGGHNPDFPGRERFTGQVVHPQAWPDDLDYANTRVVVIGSGATAVTLVPAMAETAAHVTMLQRSPTWVVARPDTDRFANTLRRVLPDRVAYAITRRKNTLQQQLVYRKTRTDPDKVKSLLLKGVRAGLGDDYDVDTHFTPSYNPWDQRLCLIPNGDLFRAIRSGSAEVVTDTITTFTETGIELSSGRHLDAAIIVTATGLQLVTLGEAEITIDGHEVDFSSTFTYKGLAYSDVPNLVSTFGYINASWTLRADLTSDYVCRVLNHMRDTDTDIAVPRLADDERAMTPRPWIDDFSAGYITRILPVLPKQGDRAPWVNPQVLSADRRLIARADVDDGHMNFTRALDRAPVGV